MYIRLEDVEELAAQGGNPIIIHVDDKPVLRIKDYSHRNAGQPARAWAFFEPFMLISSLTGRPWSQSSPPGCQLPGCNLSCAYCFNPPGTAKRVHKVSIDSLVHEAFLARGCIRISGGEPLFADCDGVKSIIEQFPANGLVYLDTNLTQDVDWNELVRHAKCKVGVCGCFKGMTQEIIDAFEDSDDPPILEEQLQIASELWRSNVDYVFFYFPAVFASDHGATEINNIVSGFAQRLRDCVAGEATYVTTPIEIRDYASCAQKVPGCYEADFGKIRRAWEQHVLGGDWEQYLPQHAFATKAVRHGGLVEVAEIT